MIFDGEHHRQSCPSSTCHRSPLPLKVSSLFVIQNMNEHNVQINNVFPAIVYKKGKRRQSIFSRQLCTYPILEKRKLTVLNLNAYLTHAFWWFLDLYNQATVHVSSCHTYYCILIRQKAKFRTSTAIHLKMLWSGVIISSYNWDLLLKVLYCILLQYLNFHIWRITNPQLTSNI